MAQNELEPVVIEVLKEVQDLSGRPWTDLDPRSRPIEQLDGFDSLASIEATALLETKLGCRIPQDSIFISDDGARALSIHQICQRLAKLLSPVGGQTR